MSRTLILYSTSTLVAMSAAVRAGPVTTFTDLEPFLEAAGDVHEIDFETLPDGSPSRDAVQITREFNYTDQGVDFFSHVPELFISGSPISAFNLIAGQQGSGGPRNWIIAELVVPATAVGVLFPGSTSLSVFDGQGELIAGGVFGFGGQHQFGGFVPDVPIASVVVDGGIEVQSIHSFLFTPIPEPTTLLLVGCGAAILLRRRLFVRQANARGILAR
jgi:hypothetical protein